MADSCGANTTLRRGRRRVRMSRNPSSDADGNPTVERCRTHQVDHVVMGRVYNRLTVHAQNFIPRPQTAVNIRRSAGHDVSNRNLRTNELIDLYTTFLL